MTFILRLPHIVLLFPLLLGLHGCSSSPDADDPTAGWTAEEIYDEAKAELDNGQYETAIQLYERLESRFPYGIYAERAQLEAAYAYYKYNEPESAILAADRFIKLHPNHPKVAYAYYLRGLASFDADQSFMNRVFRQDPTERDPKAARRAFAYFGELVRKFPNSEYSREAINRMYDLRDGLAKYEVHVINYYLKRKAYVAVVNRASYILNNYQNTPYVPDALGAMVVAYHEMGLDDLATDALRVLQLNYPDHKITHKVKKLPLAPAS
ncbi:MAG: outer membrane protein assembly factor BamD [Halobacteria archaeon]|nr:outer membrane protein assembly factor BamD [Halobacteria archaeon]